MWTCRTCKRKFKTTNQSHSCVVKDIGEFFIDCPDSLVLAFDKLMNGVLEWQPNSYGASANAIVFTNKKAWLIVKPMKSELDVKFYSDEQLDSHLLSKVTNYNNKYAHHVRIKDESEVTPKLFELLKKGFEFALK